MDVIHHSEPLDGPTIRRLQSAAREHRIWLSLGGFHETSSVRVDQSGER
jgi:hypothetical protein